MVIKFDFKLTKLLQVICLTYLELPLCEKYIENLNSFNGLMDQAFVTFLIKNYYNFCNSHYYAQSRTAGASYRNSNFARLQENFFKTLIFFLHIHNNQ